MMDNEAAAALIAEALKYKERADRLEAELAPWREMARQVEELRGEGQVVFLLDRDLTSDGKYYGYVLASDIPIPAAVAAAYEQVKRERDD